MSTLDDYEQGGTQMVVSGWLTAKQRADLAELLPARLDDAKAERFLLQVSEAVDTWESITEPGASDSDMVARLDKVQRDVRRLVTAINQFDRKTLETIAGHFDGLVWCEQPDRELPADIRQDKPPFADWMRQQVQNLRSIETVMHYAQSQIRPSNEPIKRRNARSLVRHVAFQFGEVFDRRPPKSDWFYAFMAELGGMVDCPVGKELVVSVLSD